VSCTGCIAEPGTSFPSDSIPLYVWNATSGSWDTGAGTDLRSLISSEQITNGSGLTLSQSSGKTVLSVDSSVVPTFLSATATIDFPAINTGACATEQTFSLNGANPGDSVSPGWPAGIENGLMGMMRVSAANTIAVRLCNFSGAAVDPVGASFRATVVRSF